MIEARPLAELVEGGLGANAPGDRLDSRRRHGIVLLVCGLLAGLSRHGVVRQAGLSSGRLPDQEGSELNSVRWCLSPWIEAARFSVDVQRVVALRKRRLAAGGPIANRSSSNVSEKLPRSGRVPPRNLSTT